MITNAPEDGLADEGLIKRRKTRLFQSPKTARQIAAVDARHEARLEGGKPPCVIPVQEVAPVPREALGSGQGVLCHVKKLGQSEKAKIVGGILGVQQQTQI